MKLSPDSFFKLCKDPLGETRSLLFYGNSEFWVQSKMDCFLKNNPTIIGFQPRTIPQDLVLENKKDLSLFFTKDFFSGPEIIIITQATDKIVPLVEDLDSQSAPFFLLHARDYLKPVSKLRKLYEGHPQFFSIPCYDLSSAELEKEIRNIFTQRRKKTSSELIRQIGNFFHSSPETLKSELEKIFTYMGSKEILEMADLKNLISFSGQTEASDLVDSFLERDKKKLITCINRLDESTSYISVLRMLTLSLSRLHHVKSELNSGNPLERSIKILTPPLLFHEQGTFKKQLFLWSQEEMESILKEITKIEISIKLNSKVAKEIFEFFFLKPLVLV